MADKQKESQEKKEPKDGKEKTSTAISPKLSKIIEEVEKLTVIELSELVKALEDKFGVSAAPVAAAAAAPAGGEEKEAEESSKSVFNVVLTSAGDNKIGVIKAVRGVNQNLGLKEAKDLVEAAPKEVLTEVGKEQAEEAKKTLEAAGGKVELK